MFHHFPRYDSKVDVIAQGFIEIIGLVVEIYAFFHISQEKVTLRLNGQKSGEKLIVACFNAYPLAFFRQSNRFRLLLFRCKINGAVVGDHTKLPGIFIQVPIIPFDILKQSSENGGCFFSVSMLCVGQRDLIDNNYFD